MGLKVVIIEDEKPAARRLTRMLSELNIDVLRALHSVEESVEWLQNNDHPDLIFLDIQLSDGLSFEIFEVLDVKSAIIFTTAFDEYALKAFKLNSIDYLLKPIDDEELEAAVKQFKNNNQSKSEVNVNLDEIRNLLINPIDRKFKKRITIKIGQHLKIIPINGNYADEELINYVKSNRSIVGTMDKELKKQIKNNGSSIMSIHNEKIVLEN